MRRNQFQRGVALVNAIFLLVVLATLGAYMVTLSGVSQVTTSQSILAARVYFGAKTGLEWGIHRAVGPAAGSGLCDAAAQFDPAGPGLTGVSVAVNCSGPVTFVDAGITYRIYSITSTATHGTPGNPDYADRRLEATVCRSTFPFGGQC